MAHICISGSKKIKVQNVLLSKVQNVFLSKVQNVLLSKVHNVLLSKVQKVWWFKEGWRVCLVWNL